MTDTSKSTQWKPGQTGNPNGRPRKDRDKISDPELRKLKKLLDKHTVEAVQKIITIMQTAQTPELQIKTATLIIDRKIAVDKEIERREDKADAKGASGDERQDEAVDKKPKAPVLSLKMVNADGSADEVKIGLDSGEENEDN